jgi:gamma-glutamyltranspeptidase/glutathione hydrolase
VGPDTVYLSVVDSEGNACSFINSIFYAWGSGLVVPGTGVVLHNRGATFSLDPEHPNVLAGDKRTYHTIIPAMLTVDGDLRASFGVMGGYMQPQGHLQMLVNLLDLGMAPQQALDVPRWRLTVDGGGLGASEPGGVVLMEEGWSFGTLAALTRRGHRLAPVDGFHRHIFGGGQIILRDPETGVLTGGSEPRQDGCAVGF